MVCALCQAEITLSAREWIGPATMMYIIDALTDGYGKKAEITYALETFTWIIVPVINVDGYVFSHEKNRMWRKNRQPNYAGSRWCVGTDTNRNWDYMFDAGGGASGNPCSEAYRGPSAFSAPAVKAMSEYLALRNRDGKVRVYLDIHAYSQLWMYPFGASCSKHVEREADVRAGKGSSPR